MQNISLFTVLLSVYISVSMFSVGMSFCQCKSLSLRFSVQYISLSQYIFPAVHFSPSQYIFLPVIVPYRFPHEPSRAPSSSTSPIYRPCNTSIMHGGVHPAVGFRTAPSQLFSRRFYGLPRHSANTRARSSMYGRRNLSLLMFAGFECNA